MEYKTVSICRSTTAAELVWQLLAKFRMRHRDPNLFYLTMDLGGENSSAPMALDEDSRPAELQSCHPWRRNDEDGGCRFTLRARKGALVKVHDSALMPESKYKCLLVAEKTTASEVVSILLRCYGVESVERAEDFRLVERCANSGFEHDLSATDRPAEAQGLWPAHAQFQFVLRRNPTKEEEAMDVSSSSSSSNSSCCESSPAPSPVTATHLNHHQSRPHFKLSGLVTSNPTNGVNNPSYYSSSDFSRRRFLLQQSAFQNHYATSQIMAPITEKKEDDAVIYSSLKNSNNNQTSIHESGLPPPPPLKPKPPHLSSIYSHHASLLLVPSNKRASLGSLASSGSRSSNASFHEYENYFYI